VSSKGNNHSQKGDAVRVGKGTDFGERATSNDRRKSWDIRATERREKKKSQGTRKKKGEG